MLLFDEVSLRSLKFHEIQLFKESPVRALLLVLLALLISKARAQQTGVGLMVGNPTGVSVKKWLSEDYAIDGGVGFSLGSSTNMVIHSDYLLHSKGALLFNDVHSLDVYYGLGGRMKFADDIQIGLRVPVGVAHTFEGNSVDVFGEVAPVIDFVSRSGIDLNLAFGGRFYF